ncbi:IST1-like protein [Carex littledalei]|uniref:IST1-like protein n=1 Tax=Carex littledalei TaxID=544730 RepID=A0A833QH82_9POAL|nr:IST1-like protein [Carex littledalei]
MGRKLDRFLGRISKENAKLKSLLAVTGSRAVVLKTRRGVRCTNSRDDVAQLLSLGHHDRALLRVEHVIKEQNMVDVYSMIESYCNVISERCALLEKTRECPEELREAVAGLIYGTSRCGDLQVLQDVRRIFVSKFGKDFVQAATELRNGCAVDPKLIQKLSTRLPSIEIRQRVLQEIASEKGIKLEFNDEISFHTPPATTTVDQKLPEKKGLDETFLKVESGKYKDVNAAAQAAFQSAANAAAAAKAVIELSKLDFRGDGTGGHNGRAGKELYESDKSTGDNLSLNSDSDLENVEEEEVQKNVNVEKQPESREKPKSVRTRRNNV